MPPVLTEKGITWGYTDREDGWGAATNNSLRLLSEYAFDAFAYNPVASTGLQYAFNAGIVSSGGTVARVPAGVITLTPSSTNFVERTAAGVVSANTVGFTADRVPLAVAITTVSSISSVADRRLAAPVLPNGQVVGHARLSGGNTFNDAQVFTGIVQTANVLRVGGSASPGNLGAAVVVQGAVAATASGVEFWSGGVQRGYVYGSNAAVELFAGGSLPLTLTGSGGVNVNGATKINGGLGGSDAFEVNGNVLATGNIFGSALRLGSGIILRPDNVGAAFQVDNGTNRSFADEIRFLNSNGATLFAQINASAASFQVPITSNSNVTAAGFAGSGAGLTGLGWSQIGGVPSNVVNAITQAQGDARYRQLSVPITIDWSAITSGIPANVTNAITQANGDARYRQLSVAVPWGELSGVPGNVVNAITQANGDARYRQLTVAVPWNDVTKPSSAIVAPPSGLAVVTDFTSQTPLVQDSIIEGLLTAFNALRSTVAATRSNLIASGLAS